MNVLGKLIGGFLKFSFKKILSYTSRKFVALVVPVAVNALLLKWTPGVEPKVQMFALGCSTALAAVYMLVQGSVEKGGEGFTEELLRQIK